MRSELLLGRVILIVVAAAISFAACWWSVRTCRLLWRRGTTAWGRWVYDAGVRGFGVILAISAAAFGGYAGATALAVGADDRLRCGFLGAIVGIVLGLPIALGSGYVWGTWMAKFYGLKPDDDSRPLNVAAIPKRPKDAV